MSAAAGGSGGGERGGGGRGRRNWHAIRKNRTEARKQKREDFSRLIEAHLALSQTMVSDLFSISHLLTLDPISSLAHSIYQALSLFKALSIQSYCDITNFNTSTPYFNPDIPIS